MAAKNTLHNVLTDPKLDAWCAEFVIDIEHYLAAHAAFDDWLLEHHEPSECSELVAG